MPHRAAGDGIQLPDHDGERADHHFIQLWLRERQLQLRRRPLPGPSAGLGLRRLSGVGAEQRSGVRQHIDLVLLFPAAVRLRQWLMGVRGAFVPVASGPPRHSHEMLGFLFM